MKQPDINRGVQAFKATKGAVLLDVRTPQEFREGHIPESRAEAALHSMCNSCSLFFFCGCPFPQTYRPSFHGASANIAGLGILRKEGVEVKATQFMKYSVPFTLTAVTVGYLLVWWIWM